MSQHHADWPMEPTDRFRDPSSADSPQTARRGQPPSCRLILQAGGAHEMLYVIRTIMELTRFCLEEATHKMWQAHHNGRSQLLVTYQERAELYVEQFAARGLTVTLERDQ